MTKQTIKPAQVGNWGKGRTSFGPEMKEFLLRLQDHLTKVWGFQPTLTQTLLFALNEAIAIKEQEKNT